MNLYNVTRMHILKLYKKNSSILTAILLIIAQPFKSIKTFEADKHLLLLKLLYQI